VSEPLLELTGVSARRGAAVVLHDVTWAVRAGERWVVLGGNGAGKTTLAQVASLGLRPVRGSVRLLGEDPWARGADVDDLAPSVGLCSAAVADLLPYGETVLDTVLAGAWAALRRGREPYDETDVARAEQLLRSVGAGALRDRRFGSLSEGERKRVQLARSLMADPELLVLDEPSAGLDLGGREALLGRLTRMCRDPASPALVLITHHVEEIPRGVTHALLLVAGRVLSAGPREEVLTQALLSHAFGFPLRLDLVDGRYAARSAFGW